MRDKAGYCPAETELDHWERIMIEQEFRPIASLKNQYEISADGEILRNVRTGKRRKFYKNDSGYYCVNVTMGDFKKTLYVAALVAECVAPHTGCVD